MQSRLKLILIIMRKVTSRMRTWIWNLKTSTRHLAEDSNPTTVSTIMTSFLSEQYRVRNSLRRGRQKSWTDRRVITSKYSFEAYAFFLSESFVFDFEAIYRDLFWRWSFKFELINVWQIEVGSLRQKRWLRVDQWLEIKFRFTCWCNMTAMIAWRVLLPIIAAAL